MRVALPVLLLTVALVAGGCTIGGDGDTTVLEPDRASDVVVGGTDAAPLSLQTGPGALAGTTTVVRTPDAAAPGPDAGWFVPAGPVTGITLDPAPSGDVTLRFPGTADPALVPVVWRQDPEFGWYPVAVGDGDDPAAPAAAGRREFSPHLPGWADVGRFVDSGTAGIRNWALERSGPPSCNPGGNRAPDWADLTEPTLDVLRTCIEPGTGPADGQVVLKVRNNRGFSQVLTVPPGVRFADVEGQPEPTRAAVRTLAGGADVVLLGPGETLTIGLPRPDADARVELSPRVSEASLLFDVAVQLADLAGLRGSDGRLVGLLTVQDCLGLDGGRLLQGAPPTDVAAMMAKGAQCLAEAAADPLKADGLASRLVALRTGTPPAIVRGDRAFTKQVEVARGRFRLLGAVVKRAFLIRKAVTVWEMVGEQAGRAVSEVDPATVRLDLTARDRATRVLTLRPVTADGTAAAGWSVQPGSGQVECGYSSPAATVPGIHSCSPSAAGADVCWPTEGGGAVLCLREPWDRTLYRDPATGATTPVEATPDPSPVGVELADGTRCRLRNGGSWSGRDDDPDLVGAYSCSDSGDVVLWAGGPDAFDRSAKAWTARIGTPTGPLRTVGVRTAYLAG